MPTELNRIKELAGLQQEAPAAAKNSNEQYKSIKVNQVVTIDGGKKINIEEVIVHYYPDLPSAEIDVVYSPRQIMPYGQDSKKAVPMAVAKALNIDPRKIDYSESGLQQNGSINLDIDPTLAKSITVSSESAVAEAPATTSLSPNQIAAFKKWYDTYSKMQSKDVYNYAKGIFKAHMETGQTDLDGESKQDPRGKAYDDLAKIFPDMDGDIEAIGHQLKSQGVDPLDMEAQEESVAQPVNSSVDDTIQRARAQIETLEAALKEDYKKFQGMKPYKPKKK